MRRLARTTPRWLPEPALKAKDRFANRREEVEHALAHADERWNRVWSSGRTFEGIAADRERKLLKIARAKMGLADGPPKPARPPRPQSAPPVPYRDDTPTLRRRKQCPPAQRVRYNPRFSDPRVWARE